MTLSEVFCFDDCMARLTSLTSHRCEAEEDVGDLRTFGRTVRMTASRPAVLSSVVDVPKEGDVASLARARLTA